MLATSTGELSTAHFRKRRAMMKLNYLESLLYAMKIIVMYLVYQRQKWAAKMTRNWALQFLGQRNLSLELIWKRTRDNGPIPDNWLFNNRGPGREKMDLFLVIDYQQ